MEGTDRVEQFKAEVAGMKLKDPTAGGGLPLGRLGAIGMIVGVVLTIVAYFGSHGTTNPLEQNDYLIVALIGVALAVVGTGLFAIGAITQFLKFWMARLIHEQRKG